MEIKKFDDFVNEGETLDPEQQKHIDDYMSIFNTKEELDPELQMYFTNDGMPMIRHPLVYSIMHSDMMNAMVNKQFHQKKEQCEKAILNKDWPRFIYLHERPYRLQAFQECENDMDDKTYWEQLGDIWIDSENIWQNQDEWLDCLHSSRPDREYIMDDEDREEFNKLPDTFTIYRGYDKRNKNGFSYSLDKTKAQWFASRFGGAKTNLKTVEAKKSDCVGYFGRRGEKEIIYLGNA